ncbi:MAG: homocysteine S-methyltransferase family protein, partial [bacterium]
MKNQKKDSASTAELKKLVKKRTVFFDGAMGSSLMSEGVLSSKEAENECPELLNLTRPDIIQKIHRLFCESGCDIIETNSFGAAPHTLFPYGLESKTYEINKAAALTAKEAAKNADHPVFVSGSIGPGSKLPSLGQATTEKLEESFFIQASALLEGGVDLFQIETCQDVLQAKSAYFAVMRAQKKLGTEKPVIVQFTLGKNLKTVLGSDIETIITTFSRFDLFALGLNCGTGPDNMRKSLEILSRKSPFYISVLPNAGIPSNVDGKLVYNQPPEKYAEKVSSFVSDFGTELVGGCCGTTPEHISRLVKKTSVKTKKPRQRKEFIPFFSSMYRTENMISEPPPLIIGERANATGSAKFRKALKNENIEAMMDIIVSQEKEHAHLIDISVASTGRNELEDIDRIIHKINREMTAPLCIDSTNPEVIEHALKNYGGRALINSINFENNGKTAVKIIKLARKYGASVIGLTIDDNGMAETAKTKLNIAEKIVSTAEKHGVDRRDIFIDPLTFSLGSGDRNLYTAGIETLEAISLIKKNIPRVSVMLGVSNVSYGLSPRARRRLNVVFLYHAVKQGLDAAIFHPGKLIPLSRIPEKERKLFNDLIFNRRSSDYDPLEEIITLYSSSEKK